MLSSKLLAFAGAGLLISAPIFPQHAPGFLAAGAISGGACWIIGEKEREVSKRLTGVTEKERQLKSDQDNIEVLKTKYTRSLADIEAQQKELVVQAQEIADQRLECEFIKSLKAGLDKRALEIQNLQAELDRVASEQKERRVHLEGWSVELDQLESASRSEREKLAVWANDLKHQTADIERQRVEVEKNRESFNELLKAYQIEVWEKLKPQAQAHAEAVIAERQKPLDLWCEELKQKEEKLNGILPSIDEARKKELKELEEKWQQWGKTTVDDCNERIRKALDDRNSAHDTWKNHYMALAGKTHEENQQLRKVVYSPGRHWYELQADRIIEFLNANEISVDYYQSLPTPDEKGFFVEVEPKYGKEALPEVYTKLAAQAIKEALKGIVTDCRQKPAVEVISKRVKLTFVMTSPSYTRDLEKSSGLAAKSLSKDKFKEFLSKTSQVAIIGITGGGKTELLKNTIGAFSQELGKDVNLIITNGKASRSSRELGIAKYNSVSKAIFGLLEAAVEISYRIKLNEQAETENPDDPQYPDYEPIIYLFDEYSEVATRWNSVSAKRMKAVVEEFGGNLDDDRKEILNELMEDCKPSKFASTLLNTVWRLGRSEKVRAIVAGQNLQASVMGMLRNDLLNAAFICLGDMIEWAISNRAHSFQKADLEEELEKRYLAGEEDESNKFFALYCPPSSRAYFDNLPTPGKYKSSQKVAVKNQLEELYRKSPDTEPQTPEVPPEPIQDEGFRLSDIGDKRQNDAKSSGDTQEAEGSAPEVPPEPIQDEGCRSGDIGDITGVKNQGSADMPVSAESGTFGYISVKDLERIKKIKALAEAGKTTLKEIIPEVWSDIPGIEKYKSRVWQKAREEYRRLTGK
jgi:hypothetical protein